jgi:hypothetical protein
MLFWLVSEMGRLTVSSPNPNFHQKKMPMQKSVQPMLAQQPLSFQPTFLL